jgi:diguanylate cyclase (GGDEF)-like protein
VTAPATDRSATNHTAVRLRKIIDLQSRLVSLHFNLNDFMQAVVTQVQAISGATGAVVELADGDELVYAAASGTAAGHVGLRLRLASSLSGLSVRTGEVLVSPDTSADSRVDAEACRKTGAAAMIVVPLRRLDVVVGVLKVVYGERHAFEDHEIDVLQMMAGLLGAALGQQLEIDRRHRLEQELRELAERDALTGLPNRRLFKDRLEQALARHARAPLGDLVLMYFDIDFFKKINDDLGHAAGDALLKAFAGRVEAVVRAVDTLARLGGDEFVLLLESVEDSSVAAAIAEEILAIAQDPFVLDGQSVRVGTSIGVVALAPGDRASADELLCKADGAMYAAKRAGRNAFRRADDSSSITR